MNFKVTFGEWCMVPRTRQLCNFSLGWIWLEHIRRVELGLFELCFTRFPNH